VATLIVVVNVLVEKYVGAEQGLTIFQSLVVMMFLLLGISSAIHVFQIALLFLVMRLLALP